MDLVIPDGEMPTIEGPEITRNLIRAHPAIVVLVTGSIVLLVKSMSAGADGYIANAFSAHSLISRVWLISNEQTHHD